MQSKLLSAKLLNPTTKDTYKKVAADDLLVKHILISLRLIERKG